MKWRYHLKSDDHCLYDQEPWPCTAAETVFSFVEDVEDEILLELVKQTYGDVE